MSFWKKVRRYFPIKPHWFRAIPVFHMERLSPWPTALPLFAVTEEFEKAAFSENAVRYQASLTFLDGKISGLKSALRGE